MPERVRYRYRLDGFDHDWSEPTADRQTVYTNLGYGQYRFRVIASNGDGLWNGIGGVAGVRDPADALADALVPGGRCGGRPRRRVGVYRLRLRQLAHQLNVRFEERLAERTRIAQELHDTLLQGFVSASMQLHVAVDRPAGGLPGETRVEPRARPDGPRNRGRAQRRPRPSLAAARATISSRRSPASRASWQPDRPTAYRVIVEGKPRQLNPAVRDEVYRIGREGLVNAFRHSGATAVEIEIEYAPGELRLFVRDDGRGIDPQIARTGTTATGASPA